jgi:hypothetical protein
MFSIVDIYSFVYGAGLLFGEKIYYLDKALFSKNQSKLVSTILKKYLIAENQFPILPRDPTVRDELLFQTGAPELVVQKAELWALDGRY